ncbi:hypothetical protein Bhyg_01021, partial [Pseudolycoriella hygida]
MIKSKLEFGKPNDAIKPRNEWRDDSCSVEHWDVVRTSSKAERL